ncbi:amidohydrolase family protein [Candidatus Azambacteria bacterium]|nr:amidohydrolase family protein [Candidatus Azambacteria bacterium]
MPYDFIIKNGTVIDGSGTVNMYKADVAIQGGVIAKIGFLGNTEAKTKIDAHGMYVTPGFIDVLSHSDTYLTLFTAPKQESLVAQGVTTIIGGNCGYSLAPLVSGGVIDSAQQWTDPSQININWLRMSEYLEKLEEKKFAVNFGTLTGYNTLLKGVLKGEYRQPSSQENEIVSFLLEQSLQEGSFGLSLGLAYLYQDKHCADHLESMFATVKKYDRMLTVHLRDESHQFLDSLSSVLHLAEEYGVKLHLSHLKVNGRQFWPNFKKAIALIGEARAKGLSVSFDLFPYASSALALYLLLPPWVTVGGPRMILKRLGNSFDRRQIAKDLALQALEYDKMTIASRAPDAVFVGRTISQVARNLGISGEEAIVELLVGSNLQVIVFAHVLDEMNVRAGLAHPLSVVASSGAGYAAAPIRSRGDLPHPRSFGTFPRFFKKYVREKQALSWEEAVAKSSGIAARRFGISKRGLLKEGYFADVTVCDPHAIEDAATFQDPYHLSKGIRAVLVNGAPVFRQGAFMDDFPGKILKSGGN